MLLFWLFISFVFRRKRNGGWRLQNIFIYLFTFFFWYFVVVLYFCGHCVTKVIKVFRHLPWSCSVICYCWYFLLVFFFTLFQFLLSCMYFRRIDGVFWFWFCVLTMYVCIYFIHEIYVVLIFDSVTGVDKCRMKAYNLVLFVFMYSWTLLLFFMIFVIRFKKGHA